MSSLSVKVGSEGFGTGNGRRPMLKYSRHDRRLEQAGLRERNISMLVFSLILGQATG